jgi:hypothetical protein
MITYWEERVHATTALRAQDVATSGVIGVGSDAVAGLAPLRRSTIVTTTEGDTPTSLAPPRSVIAIWKEEESMGPTFPQDDPRAQQVEQPLQHPPPLRVGRWSWLRRRWRPCPPCP